MPAITYFSGCVGITGSLGRVSANSHPGAIVIDSGLLRLHFRTIVDSFTSPGWPEAWSDNPSCTLNPMRVDYYVNSVFTQTDGVTGTPGLFADGSGTHWCKLDNVLEMRFRLGSYDAETGLHAADGYFEVRVNGVVQISVTNIALGMQGTARYSNIAIAPSGTWTPDDSVFGGMISSYGNKSDVYGAGDPTALWNETYAAYTDAQIFLPTGPWVHNGAADASFSNPPYPITAPPPTIVPGSGKMFANISYMSRSLEWEPTPNINAPLPCCDTTTRSPTTPNAPNPGPVVPPIKPDWVASCSGGGSVPTAADIVNSEDWAA